MNNVFLRIHNDINNRTSTRIELVGFVVSLFAFLSHFCFLVLFYCLKIKPMFYFNIGSVIFFSILFFTFKKSQSYLLSYSLSTIEVIIHQVFAAYFTGVQTGFQYYIILISIIGFLELENHLSLSIVFAIICNLCFILIEVGMMNLTPVYELPKNIIKIIKTTNIGFTLFVIAIIEYVFTITVKKAEHAVQTQYNRAEKLLYNIMPVHIINKLKSGSSRNNLSQSYNSVAVLFLDIVDFSKSTAKLEAKSTLTILNSLFSCFDEIIDEFHIEKIKTSGDSYMAVTGIPNANDKSLINIALFALRMLRIVSKFNIDHHCDFKVRIGIHYGPVAAGIIGKKKIIYDLVGSTVNLASQLELTCVAGRIQVSKEIYDNLCDKFEFEQRPPIPVKGFGMLTNYYLIAPYTN